MCVVSEYIINMLVYSVPTHRTLHGMCEYINIYVCRLCHLTVHLNNRPVELKLSPTATIEELKMQASRMFGVPADLQKWVGWPSGLPDHVSM